MNINLLPWREQRLQKMWYQFLLLSSSCIMVTITVVIFLHYIIITHNRYIFSQYTQLQNKINAFSKNKANASASPLSAQTLLFLKQSEFARKNMLAELRAITQALPSTCYLTQLQYHHAWLMQGRASDMQSISEFMLHLKQYHRFHQVMLTNVVGQKNQKYFTYHIYIS
jgi:Tfp pilus assembly protein PilN